MRNTRNKNMQNEKERVQLPSLVHLTRLGYQYFGKITEEQAGTVYDQDTNILTAVFEDQFDRLNPGHKGEGRQLLEKIRQELNYNDIGRSFYERLTTTSPIKLIDFDSPENNVYHCTAEFTCKNGDDSFRPDITLFINGLPLVFIEVKKPNNPGGMLAESERMNKRRFPNEKFRRFLNITQLMIFSNNMEYDAKGGTIPIQGVFYCTAAKDKASFNCFREENPLKEAIAPYVRDYPYLDIAAEVERNILKDFNSIEICTTPEYKTNICINTPTNRVITSMCSPERLLFLIKYGIAYVKDEREVDGKPVFIDQKHIMRYQQFFATNAVRDKLNIGKSSGVIWHTQGSGKTALSYYLTRVLKDFYAKQNKVAKFYFIVDRLDLLEQAKQEFKARGLEVKTANTREELMRQFQSSQSLEGVQGKNEITVVNIQRFSENSEPVNSTPYATNLQRVFIVDEAHRGYNPAGSFLANLFEADKEAIKIALTGTPLLKDERTSWKIFGEYYHTYYYDKSIQDGYTLKIMREDIETSYKENLSQVYNALEQLIAVKDIKRVDIVEHKNYVKALLKYIIDDLTQFRLRRDDDTLGGMIVCETSDQARQLFKYFDEVQNELCEKKVNFKRLRAGLILHDNTSKEERKQTIKDYKKSMKVDILIVYNMLLTGFDAPRLKKLYLGRKLRDHNLLQAITRVNRPYKNNKYGYIVDFADIKADFEETNMAYMKELERFNSVEETGLIDIGDTFQQVIEDPDTLIKQLKAVQDLLFNYSTDNLEYFSREISACEDKSKLIELKKALELARDSYNIVRIFGDEALKESIEKIDMGNVPQLLAEVQNHINLINQKILIDEADENTAIVSEAMQYITFNFNIKGNEELEIKANNELLNDQWSQVVRSFGENIDPEDPELVNLRDAFIQRFKEFGFSINAYDEYERTKDFLVKTSKQLKEIQEKNDRLVRHYNGDAKFARVHKRIVEENKNRAVAILSKSDVEIFEMLINLKNALDQKIWAQKDILTKPSYFEKEVMHQICKGIDELHLENSRNDRIFIRTCVAKEYLKLVVE